MAVNYVLNRSQLSGGGFPLTLGPKQVDTTTTSLTLPGQLTPNYGQFIDENFIYMLENFASTTAPRAPLQGQLWFDATTNRLNFFDINSTWQLTPILNQGSTTPETGQFGELWFNTSTNVLYYSSPSGFVPFSNADNGAAIVDTDAGDFLNIGIDSMSVATFSPTTFTPNPSISGFPTIFGGLTFNTNNVFNTVHAGSLLPLVDNTYSIGKSDNRYTSSFIVNGTFDTITVNSINSSGTLDVGAIKTSAGAFITGSYPFPGVTTSGTLFLNDISNGTGLSFINANAQGINAQIFDFIADNSGVLHARAVNNDYSVTNDWLSVTTSNVQIATVNLNAQTLNLNGITNVPSLNISGITTTQALTVATTSPILKLQATSAGSNQTFADFIWSGTSLLGRVVNDAYSSSTTWIEVDGNFASGVSNIILTSTNISLNGITVTNNPATGDNSQKLATTSWTNTAINAIAPVGMIVMWNSSASAIPSRFQLCDGTNGTPDLRNKFIVGAGQTYANGSTGGTTTNTISTAQLPVHSHGVIDPGHAHGVGDPGHSHGVNDPSHSHVVQRDITGGSEENVIAGGFGFNNTYQTVSEQSNTGISIQGSGVGIGIFASGTGISIQNTGSGSSVNNLPPYFALCYIQRMS